MTYAVLLRESKDEGGHMLEERTYRSLVEPKPGGGPYLSQEGQVFLVDEVDGGTIYGRLVRARSDTA